MIELIELGKQLFLLVLGLALELLIEIFLPPDRRKQLARILAISMIAVAIWWAGYAIGQGHSEKMLPPFPQNAFQRMDFEADISDSITLDVCDAIPPSGYENCYQASSDIDQSNNSYTGDHSLAYRAELLPSVERVYSVNIPINPPVLADAVSSYVFIPEAAHVNGIRLLVKINSENNWIVSEVSDVGGGWIYMYLDLQTAPESIGSSGTQTGIDEIDIDVFLPRGDQRSLTVEIDDVTLYFRATRILDSP